MCTSSILKINFLSTSIPSIIAHLEQSITHSHLRLCTSHPSWAIHSLASMCALSELLLDNILDMRRISSSLATACSLRTAALCCNTLILFPAIGRDFWQVKARVRLYMGPIHVFQRENAMSYLLLASVGFNTASSPTT